VTELLRQIAALLWLENKQVWAARARGSSKFHEARTVEEAVALALTPEEDQLW
jgi:hypothetical protein